MNLDIHGAVTTAIVVSVIGAIFWMFGGMRRIINSRRTQYHRIQRDQEKSGWVYILFAFILIIFSLFMEMYAEPIAYRYFPPSPTLTFTMTTTLVPSRSLTSTISLTPTTSLTPAESYTPTNTSVPQIPQEIVTLFTANVTPGPDVKFSPLVFSRKVVNYVAVDPESAFSNPIDYLFATYTYDGMLNGVQWTALFYRGDELVQYETGPWEGGTGGNGQYKLIPSDEQWLPAEYRLLFFVGNQTQICNQMIE